MKNPVGGGSDNDAELVREALKEVSEQKGSLQAVVSSLQEALARERELGVESELHAVV